MDYISHNDTLVVTSQCRFDEKKFPLIDGLFGDIIGTFASANGITPPSYGVMGVTPLFATEDAAEVTQDEPEIEIILLKILTLRSLIIVSSIIRGIVIVVFNVLPTTKDCLIVIIRLAVILGIK